jgi:hypothetical protein
LEELEQFFEAAKETTAAMNNLGESVVVPAIEEGALGGLVGVDMIVAGAEDDGIPPAVPVVVAADPQAEKVTTNAALIINKSVQPEDRMENRKLSVRKAVVVEMVDGKTSQPLDAEAEAGLSPEDRAAFGLDDPRPSAFAPTEQTTAPRGEGDGGNVATARASIGGFVVVTAAIIGFVLGLVLVLVLVLV